MSTDELETNRLIRYLSQPALRDTYEDTIETVLSDAHCKFLDGVAKLTISIGAHHGLLLTHDAVYPIISTTVAVWTRMLARDKDLIHCLVRAHNIINRQNEDQASDR